MFDTWFSLYYTKTLRILVFLSLQPVEPIKRLPRSHCLSALVAPVFQELKEQRCAGAFGSVQELENAFSLAEESSPGITDQLISHLVQRVQRGPVEGNHFS
uniref:Programmed cell death protein 10 dimerisation domain-containing protein n=1 Tax=Engystomops pustulosus TaxID=76066 RepID=A0AAV6Z2V6_ENGPU|nr:hypothetical protein GDO81_018694 [Engystomops pustulosus]